MRSYLMTIMIEGQKKGRGNAYSPSTYIDEDNSYLTENLRITTEEKRIITEVKTEQVYEYRRRFIMALAIKGLVQVEQEEFDGAYYYFSKEMLENHIVINSFDIIHEEHFGTKDAVETIIEVKHLSEQNAQSFTLYQGLLLEKIQLYRIIKDIKELYDQNNLNDFLDIMKSFSGSYMSSQMQTEVKNRFSIKAEMQEEFHNLKKLNDVG